MSSPIAPTLLNVPAGPPMVNGVLVPAWYQFCLKVASRYTGQDVFTSTTLPRPRIPGRVVFCSNARKPACTGSAAEGAGLGTGMLVVDDGVQWTTTAGQRPILV